MEDVVRETIEDILRRKWREIKRRNQETEAENWSTEDKVSLELIGQLLEIFE